MNILKMALVAGVVLCSANAALADAYDDIIAAGKIRVSTDLAIPPSGMLDAELKPIGSDVETAQLLASDWGLELEFVPTTGATRIPNLQTGKADLIISTLSVTPQRAEVIDFTLPYAVFNSVVGAPKAAEISDWEDLRGKAVTVTRGTTQDTALTPLAGERGYTITRYDDDATMVTAAVSGQAAAVATSETLINQIGERNPQLAFEPKFTIQVFDLAMGVRKGETQLKEKLDAWIAENLKNGKLNDIYQKYHGSPLPAEMLN